MKTNRTGNDSDRGRSGKAQRRSEAKRQAAAHGGEPPVPEAAPSVSASTAGQGAANGVDSASAGDTDGTPETAEDRTGAGHRSSASAAHDTCDDANQTAAATAQIADLSARIEQLQNDLLRKQADFENARKRLIRDKEEAIKYANMALLLDLTGVLDDFGRAISASADGRDFATLHSGIELIEKQFLATLERKWGLIRFDSAGQPFDPERHEALATEASTEHPEATVIEDYQKGYTLHGRVIRAARVRVATPVEQAPYGAAGADPQSDPDGAG